MPSIEELVDRWSARDAAQAFLPRDRDAIDATHGPRALVVTLLLEGAAPRDLFHACATLGRLIAAHGGSPSLASDTLDSVRDAVPNLNEETIRAARRALAEGYGAACTELTASEALVRWEFPGCVVALENSGIAIAAGYPEDDEDALAAWAARVASAVARKGYRRATVAGGGRAVVAVADALELAGVTVRTTAPPTPLGT